MASNGNEAPLQSNRVQSEPLSTIDSYVTAWADEQSLSEERSQENSDRLKVSTTQRPGLIRYDIAALLKLRQAMDERHVELRINPSALADNFFKEHATTRPTRHRKTNSRGLSSFTHRSMDSDEELTFEGRFVHQPSRQPRPPPQTPDAQQSEGFARFLKDHASPPHHRVTAGGRIVPAGPLPPPPMLTLSSINAILEKQSKVTKLPGKLTQSGIPPCRPQSDFGLGKSDHNGNGSGIAYSGTLGAPIHMHGAREAGYSNAINQSSALSAHPMQPIGPMTQFSTGSVPSILLQDGSTVYSLNGNMYRSYWNGKGIEVENVNPQSSTLAPSHCLPAGSTIMQPWFGTQSSLKSQTLLENAVSGSQSYLPNLSRDLHIPSLHDQYQNLHSQLTALDKHVALHLHKLPPTVHASLVAKRRELVEHLDAVRLAKEQSERSGSTAIPMANPYPIGSASDYQHDFASKGCMPNFGIPPVSVGVPPGCFALQGTSAPAAMAHNTDKGVNRFQGVGINKGLSPSAPAFIPSFAQRVASATGSLPNAELTQHVHPNHTMSSCASIQPIDGNSAAQASDSSRHMIGDTSFLTYQEVHSAKNGVIHRVAAASNQESSTEEERPLVSDQEVEYVDRLGFDPIRGRKSYCTEPAEFQEVIHRAREQARMYGCLGGQSKDPAYDAEQDIRWAMSNSEPIRLPGPTADHFLKPRPWNWSDSAYNYHTNEFGNGASTYSLALGSKTEEKKATFPPTPPQDSNHELKKHQRLDSWDIDPVQNCHQEANAIRCAAGKTQIATRNGHEDAVSRCPLSATSGNTYPSHIAKDSSIRSGQFMRLDTTKRYGIQSKTMTHLDKKEKVDPTTTKDQRPETPLPRPCHAYVESDSGSPEAHGNQYKAILEPADIVNVYNTTKELRLSEDGLSGGLTDSWGPGNEDTFSDCSWGPPEATVKLSSSNSGQQTTTAAESSFKVPSAVRSAKSTIEKETLFPKKHESVGSSSLTDNKPAHGFLRGMLHSIPPPSSSVDKARKIRGYVPPEKRQHRKYIAECDGWGLDDEEEDQCGKNNGENKVPVTSGYNQADSSLSSQDARAIKAPSSLASSAYHAQGHLPQCDRSDYPIGGTAYHTLMPHNQGANGYTVTSHAPAQGNPRNQYNAADYRNYLSRNSHYNQSQNPSGGRYWKAT